MTSGTVGRFVHATGIDQAGRPLRIMLGVVVDDDPDNPMELENLFLQSGDAIRAAAAFLGVTNKGNLRINDMRNKRLAADEFISISVVTPLKPS